MNGDEHDKPLSDESSQPEEAKIHAEEVKDRHTTHWDRDYLSTEELDAAHREGKHKEGESGDTGPVE